MTSEPSDQISEQQAKVEGLSKEIAYLTVAGMRDNLSPQERELVRNLERSARAEKKLRLKGLAYLRQQQSISSPTTPTTPSPDPEPTS